jgi:hypothetical protein
VVAGGRWNVGSAKITTGTRIVAQNSRTLIAAAGVAAPALKIF